MFIIWAPFAIASALTFLVYRSLWALEWYWTVLSLLGGVCGILAIRILRQTGLHPWPILGVVVGLLVGQWWFIQTMVLQLLWRSNGFAP